MFPEMRRKRQQLSREEAEAVLTRGTSGVLAVAGADGYPYAVPLSYVYQNGKLWFHCAKSGHKLDAIRREDKASFCVIDHLFPQRHRLRAGADSRGRRGDPGGHRPAGPALRPWGQPGAPPGGHPAGSRGDVHAGADGGASDGQGGQGAAPGPAGGTVRPAKQSNEMPAAPRGRPAIKQDRAIA